MYQLFVLWCLLLHPIASFAPDLRCLSRNFNVALLAIPNEHSQVATGSPSAIPTLSTGGYRECRSAHSYSTVKALGSLSVILATVLQVVPDAAQAAGTSDNGSSKYIDEKNGFVIEIPGGFSSMPRKKGGGDSLSTGQPVEILLVAQDFQKGASLSVGRSDVPQLLDDFSVPWAGKPIKSIADVGTANIVSELLILQRQGAFGSIFFKTKLGVTAANDAELTNMDNNISEIVSASLDVSKNSVMFEFKTPLSAGIRYTIANSFLRGKYLYTVWLSVLGPVYATDYKDVLTAARNSFQLLKSNIPIL